jgi:hypothetical protein
MDGVLHDAVIVLYQVADRFESNCTRKKFQSLPTSR